MGISMQQVCGKCNKKKPGLVSLRISKQQIPLCPVCFNDWLDAKDNAVDKAYKEWIKQ